MTAAQLSTFTLVHVIISLIGIASGLIVMLGFLSGRSGRTLNGTFLVFTILTSVTGFFFPFHGVTPGIVVGVLSLVVLAIAVAALLKHWRKTYIITAAIAEFLNVLVLIIQSFQKIPALHQLAPTGSEPVVAITQALALIFFVVLAILAIRKPAFSLS